MYILTLAILCFSTATYSGGFSGNTSIKIIQKTLKPFNINDHEIRKTKSFELLYQYQNRLRKSENLNISTYTLPYLDSSRQPFYGPIKQHVYISKQKTNTVIGINLSAKKRNSALDFDIICDPKQIFATTGLTPHSEARDLSVGDSLLCVKDMKAHGKKIHAINTIKNEKMDIYRIFAEKYCMILLSRYGAMGLVPIVITEQK